MCPSCLVRVGLDSWHCKWVPSRTLSVEVSSVWGERWELHKNGELGVCGQAPQEKETHLEEDMIKERKKQELLPKETFFAKQVLSFSPHLPPLPPSLSPSLSLPPGLSQKHSRADVFPSFPIGPLDLSRLDWLHTVYCDSCLLGLLNPFLPLPKCTNSLQSDHRLVVLEGLLGIF